MSDRETLFAQASQMISQGARVDVIGDRGSGRSTFCRRLHERFAELDWEILAVSGLPSFQAIPLMALSLAGVENAQALVPRSVPAIVAELIRRLPSGRSLIVVDDWDDLDETSWGVIHEVHRRARIPVVLTRVAGRSPRLTPTGHVGAAVGEAFSVELGLMRLPAFERALVEHLDGAIDNQALSRIFAESGGNIGLALAVTDAARWDGRLTFNGESWRTNGDLWSDTLRLHIDVLLEPLDEAERDLLEMLSILGIVDLSAVEGLGEAKTLERLERLGFVTVIAPSPGSVAIGQEVGESGAGAHIDLPALQTGSSRVSVRPPLIADYFRHQVNPVRRSRLLERLRAAPIGAPSPQIIEPTDQPTRSSALLIRMVHEQQRTRLQVARHAWDDDPSPRAALAYLRALLDAHAASGGLTVEQTVERFLATARPALDAGDAADEPTLVAWTLLHAEWLAYARYQPQTAMALLNATAPDCRELGAALRAFAAEIECDFLGAPDLTTLPDPDDESLPDQARLHLHRTHALVATADARFADAGRHLEAIRALSPTGLDLRSSVLLGHTILADQGPDALHEFGMHGLADAESRLDPAGIRAFGALCAFADFLAGRYDRLETVIEVAAHLGDPEWQPPFAQLSLLILGSTSAARLGARQLALTRDADLRRLRTPDGPLPTQHRLLSSMQSAASRGNLIEAAELAMKDGEEMWRRGQRFNAVFAFVAALEIDPTPARSETATSYLEQIDDAAAGFVMVLRDYGYAMASDDAERVESAAERMIASQRFASGLALLRRAQTLRQMAGQAKDAARIKARITEVSAEVPGGPIDFKRFSARYVQLTEREQHVALLAARGLTNAQIANELVITQRTTENHLHRIMTKLGISSRTQLKDWIHRIS